MCPFYLPYQQALDYVESPSLLESMSLFIAEDGSALEKLCLLHDGVEASRGVARILGKGVLDYAREARAQNLSHAHLLTGKVEVQIVIENAS